MEQPLTTSKQGKVTVRYPRGAEAAEQLHAEALDALNRARRPEDALAVVLRLLVAQRLAVTDGLPNADGQGVYEPQELARSPVLDKLARRVTPPSVKQHLAEQDAERERREPAWRDEQEARLLDQRERLAAGESVDCACCLGPIETATDAVDSSGSLVHAGECAERWGSEIEAAA